MDNISLNNIFAPPPETQTIDRISDQEIENLFLPHTYEPSEEDKKKNHEKRMKMCGQWAVRFDPHTGGYKTYQYECGLYKECPRCKARREAKIKQEITEIVASHPVQFQKFEDKKSADKFVRELSKEDYERYPIADGTEIIIYKVKKVTDSIEIYQLEDRIDFGVIASGAEGRNKSGSLVSSIKSLSEDKEDDEEFTFVKITEVISNASEYHRQLAAIHAIEQTSHLDPQTPEEVEDAIRARTRAYIAKLSFLTQDTEGIYIHEQKKSVKVYPSKIKWINTESLTKNLKESVRFKTCNGINT